MSRLGVALIFGVSSFCFFPIQVVGKRDAVAVPTKFALDHDDGGIRPFKNDNTVSR